MSWLQHLRGLDVGVAERVALARAWYETRVADVEREVVQELASQLNVSEREAQRLWEDA